MFTTSSSFTEICPSLVSEVVTVVSNSGIATAPPPIPQPSDILIDGADTYPAPKLFKSIPNNAPVALIIGFPEAPEPPPPINDIVGGPHGICAVLHAGASPPSSSIAALILSEVFLIPEETFSVKHFAPPQKLHSSPIVQSKGSSQERNFKIPPIKSKTSNTLPTISPTFPINPSIAPNAD